MIIKPNKLTKKTTPNLHLLWRGMSYSLLMLVVISCNDLNQPKSNVDITVSPAVEQLTIIESKVIIPQYGFNSGLLASNGDLWFGSNGGGLYRYDPTSAGFTHYTQENGLNSNIVLSMIEDKNSDLWFGTADGLLRYDGKSFTHIPIPYSDTSSIWLDKVYPIINPNAVHSLLEDKKGNIWIGTGGAGAYRYDGNKFTSFLTEIGHKQEDSLNHNWITSIVEDANGHIWFSSMTRGGANRFDGENFTQFMPEDGLFTDMVRTIFKDKEGIIWFGYKATHDGGFTRYDGKYFVNFNKTDGLCNHSVRVIYEDKDENLWLGGDLNPLCIYDGENFNKFSSEDDKNFNGILTILEDAEGNIWFGGKNGLWQFDGETVTNMTK
ncbi:MAG: hypothetical protein GQ574_07265 [Crocinitomix sp.]|nr:hypothetical protein [Crocinitomix sp.]